MADLRTTDLVELAEQPAVGDLFDIVDVSDTTGNAAGTSKKITRANILGTILDAVTAAFTTADETKLDGIEALADVTDAGNVGSVNAAATSKTTPVDADSVPIVNSESSNVIGRVTFTNLKAFLKTYFDTLYVSGVSVLTTASTIDDSNLDFVFSSKPTQIFINHQGYIENDGWTWSGSTATLTGGPVGTNGSIYGTK